MVNINDCVIDIGSNIYLTAPLFFYWSACTRRGKWAIIYLC